MAVDRKPEPPGSAEDWDVWVDACIQTNSRQYLPTDIGLRWPEGEPWPGNQGVTWIPLAEDHPFQGHSFCWRCIAEAEGWSLPDVVPHAREIGTVCWESSTLDGVQQELSDRDEAAEDSEPDFCETRLVAITDPSRQAVDTGTFFYVPSATTAHLGPIQVTPEEASAIIGHGIRGVSIDEPEPLSPERWRSEALAAFDRIGQEIAADVRKAMAGYECPGASWNCQPFEEPAVPDESERPAPQVAPPVPQDAPDDEDRQPETDAGS